MDDDPEELTDDLISESSLFAMNLRAGVLESAIPAQVNAIMSHYAQTAEKLATAYRDEVHRRRTLEEEAKTGLYLRGADSMAKALVWAEHSAKQSRHWLDAAAIERRGADARRAYDKASHIKLVLAAGFGAAIIVFALYAFRRATFYSLAGSVLLWVAAGLLVMAVASWIDLTQRQKATLKEANYWFELSASKTRKAEEFAARRVARLAKAQAANTQEAQDDDA